MNPIDFGIIGTGWRTAFFLRIARALPDRFHVLGVVGSNVERRAAVQDQFGVPAFASLDALLDKAAPSFIVTAVRWPDAPAMIREVVKRGLPCLSETPPAPDLDSMRSLWADLGPDARVQVAEQYWRQPHHAARLALIHSGKLGRINQAQISAAHGYHGISLIRRSLGIGFELPRITGKRFMDHLVAGPGRDGPPTEERITEDTQDLVWLDWGDRLGVMDFQGEQYFNWVRTPRVLIRGERGEIVNDRVHYLRDFHTPITLDLLRREAGPRGNLEGHHLKGIQLGDEWIYTNPVAPASLPDDEIAIADCLLRMDEYVRTGLDFYPLAEACQDHYLSILSSQSCTQGLEITPEPQPWSA